MKAPHPWPKLSEDLRGPRHPLRCQRCGTDEALSRWRECDEQDLPSALAVVLCRPCEEKIIKPHPRLYAEIPEHAPFPGTMALCVGCAARDGVRCASGQALANGGPGLTITTPRPTRLHGRFSGGAKMLLLYPGPPTHCSAREPLDVIPAPPPATRPERQGALPLSFADPSLPPTRRSEA